MKIHNVRLGLATNSSSTHSLIFLPKGEAQDSPDAVAGEFGWEHFTAASEATKRKYLALLLHHSLCGIMSSELARTITREWSGVMLERGHYGDVAGHIDHQSQYVLPSAWRAKQPDREFFDEFKAFLLREDLVILGGNDNNDTTHPLTDRWSGDFRLPIPQDGEFMSDLVCRKDALGWWTLFDRRTGAKIRFSFDNGAKVEAQKASAPELVDVKITDYCSFGCAYCYQGSTTVGKHATNMAAIAGWCGDNRVFEVAIGGGEPTSHPKIQEILTSFRYYGVVPNMTTKSLSWLTKGGRTHNQKRDSMLKALGAFAYSAETSEDVENAVVALRDATNGNEEAPTKMHIQHVLGTRPSYELSGLLRTCNEHHLTVTLLGYKTTGRGKDVAPHPYKDWLKTAMELKGRNELPYRFGIDTALAAESKTELKKAGVPSWCYATQEGKFSMYIDAVEGKFGPSSYCDPLRMKPFDLSSQAGDALIEEFRKW